MKLSELLVQALRLKSKNEAKRLIKQGAIEINGKKITIDAEVVFRE